ncbi:MAG: Rpp14/Pop5 family protein [Candidatus Bathyarchaeota archaeon]|nr:Rpp14/Pop5 family protein [Candidatus Bathyarchaeota archaeon]
MLKKVKRRYLALSIDSQESFSSEEFINAVWLAVQKLFGECGASQTGLRLIDYDAGSKLAVIRVFHVAVEQVRAALAAITEIGRKPAAVHVITVSGTLKALYSRINSSRKG